MLPGGNLAEAEPLMVLSLDDEALKVLAMPLVMEVFEEKVEEMRSIRAQMLTCLQS